MAPMGVIPFKITETRALYIFKDWIKDRFLAPDKLEQNAQLNKFYGIYVPLFTFDTLTVNRYTGRCINDGKTWFKSGKYQFQVDDLEETTEAKTWFQAYIKAFHRGKQLPGGDVLLEYGEF